MDLASGIIRRLEGDVSGTLGALVISSDGSRIAFDSSANFTGGNADRNNEIYSVAIGAGALSVRQLTSTTGAPVNRALSISNSGDVFLTSTRDFVGNNGGAITQLFTVNADTGAFRQHTSFTQSSSILNTKISADGNSVYFRSARDLVGENSQLGTQFFKLDLSLGSLEQLTNYASGTITGSLFSISGDGGQVYFVNGTTLNEADITAQDSNVSFEVGAGAAGAILSQIQGTSHALRGLGAFSLTSQFGARLTLDRTRENLANISILRGTLGASLSRLSTASSFLEEQRGEVVAAESRLTSADVAEESAALVRTSILQQVSTAVLAQANQQPQLLLGLLR